jgi:predicted transcriptional regulator
MSMGKKEDNGTDDIEIIKRLFTLLLIEKGFTQDQLAKVMGISQSSISRMFPGGVPKKKEK